MRIFPRVSLALVTAAVTAVLRGANPPGVDAVVAADGSGAYRSVQEAISAAPMRVGAHDPRWVILVKPGTYRERVYVQRERGNLTVRGEDAATTVITFDLSAKVPGPDGKPIGTFHTPTVQVDGDGMVWEDLTIANSAGPVGQAVALRVDGDRVSFRRCRFFGWQDTILVNRGRHYFADCYIEGHIDFIFGGATAYFERCHIHCLGDGYITAASTPEGQEHGFVFADCTITGAEGVRTYLGRPWRDYARTVFLRTQMSGVVRPEGWHNWDRPAAERTTHYAEFACTGAGAQPSGRVAWRQKLLSGDSARYTPTAVLAGADGWAPAGGPTLHFAGDSTMADKPDLTDPERGWGQRFRELVRPPLRFANYAVNGRSTKSFLDLGNWDRLLQALAPGDWVVIQFGHNDPKQADPTRYTSAATDFPANLRRFVAEVRAHGAHPVLATPVVRREWTAAGQLEDTHGAYLAAVRNVAAEEHVPLLELEAATRALVTQLGPAGSKALYMNFAPGEYPGLPAGKNDNTHFTATGARLVAALAAGEMRRLHLPIADFLMTPASAPWQPDLGDGRYRNPVLAADYSDPDVVRVGDDYWMTASSFSHVPGLPLLHSRDLVNWTLVGHALPRLVPDAAFRSPRPGEGVWAPAIRFHAGQYWIYYPDPDFGIYVVTARDPRGPWSAPVLVKGGKGLIDPCPLWDDDGRVYLIHAWAKSRAGFNNVLTLLRLSADGLHVEEDLGIVIDGAKYPGTTTLEGPKLYKRNGWYYVFAPAGGVATGWQVVYRARDIRGPYADRIVLAQGTTPINGPHQGALVDTPSGEFWFLHFQDQGVYGRVVHLQPAAWRDDWPLLGSGVGTGAACGEPVLTHAKPALPAQAIAMPPTSDDFTGPRLGPQWQWQANPGEGWYSCAAVPGALRLHAQPSPRPGNLYTAPHLLLQKFPASEFSVTVQLELAAKTDGDSAGLIIFGRDYAWLGLRRNAGRTALVYAIATDAAAGAPQVERELAATISGPVQLRAVVRAGGAVAWSYRTGDGDFTAVPGPAFPAKVGHWVGAKVGIFAAGAAGASADFARFQVGPASLSAVR